MRVLQEHVQASLRRHVREEVELPNRFRDMCSGEVTKQIARLEVKAGSDGNEIAVPLISGDSERAPHRRALC
jgi:hypothetical protein